MVVAIVDHVVDVRLSSASSDSDYCSKNFLLMECSRKRETTGNTDVYSRKSGSDAEILVPAPAGHGLCSCGTATPQTAYQLL